MKRKKIYNKYHARPNESQLYKLKQYRYFCKLFANKYYSLKLDDNLILLSFQPFNKDTTVLVYTEHKFYTNIERGYNYNVDLILLNKKGTICMC